MVATRWVFNVQYLKYSMSNIDDTNLSSIPCVNLTDGNNISHYLSFQKYDTWRIMVVKVEAQMFLSVKKDISYVLFEWTSVCREVKRGLRNNIFTLFHHKYDRNKYILLNLDITVFTNNCDLYFFICMWCACTSKCWVTETASNVEEVVT